MTETTKCPECGYDLRGIPEDRCPECGFGFQRAAIRSLIGIEVAEELFAYRRAVLLGAFATGCVLLLTATELLRWLLLGALAVILCLLASGRSLTGRSWFGLRTFGVLTLVPVLLLAILGWPRLLWLAAFWAVAQALVGLLRTPPERHHASAVMSSEAALSLRRWRIAAWVMLVVCVVSLIAVL